MFKQILIGGLLAIPYYAVAILTALKLISFTNQIDSDEWQPIVIQIPYLRYGTNLIEVPD